MSPVDAARVHLSAAAMTQNLDIVSITPHKRLETVEAMDRLRVANRDCVGTVSR